jgi:antitoxin ParD1/3/4
MTVKTTLSFTDRHHRFLMRSIKDGVFATQSAAVAAALEQMIQDENEREVALTALAQEVRARTQTPRSEFVDQDNAFSAARAAIETARKT